MENKIVGCEIATSNRAKCHVCRSKIFIGNPRIYFNMNWKKRIKDKKNYRTTGYIKDHGGMIPWEIKIKRVVCHKCANEVLEYDIEMEKQEVQRLKNIKINFNRQMKTEKIQKLIRNQEIMEELEKNETNNTLY